MDQPIKEKNKRLFQNGLNILRGASIAILLSQATAPSLLMAQSTTQQNTAKTPIKHVVIIVGENRTFDHLFATYKPRRNETVDNLLSKGIIDQNGNPGRNYFHAAQYSADVTDQTNWQMNPSKKTIYDPLPAPLTGGPQDVCADNKVCTIG